MRDQTKLKPELQRKIKRFLAKCEKQGYKVGIGECVRSAAEQDALYAIGRTTQLDRKPVTNARGATYSSQHQWCIAFDIFRNDGKGAYYDDDSWFYKVSKIAKSVGLGWGGDFHSIHDKPHFYLKRWGPDTSTLKKKYDTPQNFIRKFR